MSFPDFYDQVRPLRLFDPLAQLLGASETGVLEYRYADALKLAGHSCPTLAGAWLMAGRAMAALYPDGLPLRGGIRVALREAQSSGTAGVVGSIFGLLTGAAGEGGFKGLAGQFRRCNLLEHGVPMDGDARFTRMDNGASVEVAYAPQAVPPAPRMAALMARVNSGEAGEDERIEFGRLWQDRVRRILLEHAEDPALIRLTRISG